MAMAEQRPLPMWAMAIGNSRLLLSATGAGFLIDAGFRGTRPKLDELAAQGRLKSLDGIWITHYHDDHTDYAQALADQFRCPIYFTPRLSDILEHPSHYRMPCLTTASITSGKPQGDGTKMRWHEFQLTFFEFPGQTLYHDGLLAERDGGGALFFTGDSFTPSGMDNYCLQNRDFLHDGQGYLYCLRALQRLPKNVWLVNQHVEPTFRFSDEQYARMRAEFLKQGAALAELSPWPDPNYAIDESWASIDPYATETRSGDNVTIRLRILNHSPRPETYRLKWNLPAAWKVVEGDRELAIPARAEREARAVFAVKGDGVQVITADVTFGDRQLREWVEALIRVRP
jgi:glyoxylase-like metal-dependent hydrolase (beta-lactamase superfamily II)